ncbi:MAG: DUF2961 domain-containing protein [Phycisphaerae bacterium]|nr:DUF2961 domain-containing protein [Phycisphaerae bacterium]
MSVRWHIPAAVCAVTISVLAAVGADLTGYESLADWSALPNPKVGMVAGLASSYDRAGANNDFSQFESPVGLVTSDVNTVVKTITGPGVLTRFWMPHACADEAFTVKLTIDGTLLIDTTSNVILGGSFGYMQNPLVRTLIGGQVSYEPIAFQNSVVIESNNYAAGLHARTHHFYQYGYHVFTGGQTIPSYSGSLNAAQQTARDSVVAILGNLGKNPAGTSEQAAFIATEGQSIEAGQALTLCDRVGSGRVRAIRLKMTGPTDEALDGLRLRVRCGGRSQNVVDVPVAHFFGAGHKRVAFKSLPLGTDGPDGFYCYWPMPYRVGLIIELYNSTTSAIAIDSALVEYESGAQPAVIGCLYASFSEETTVSGQKYHQLLSSTGAGHYLGSLLYVQKAGVAKILLEGDEIVTVDGTTMLFGTGMEDAYNGGYYYNNIANSPQRNTPDDPPWPDNGVAPYHGLLNIDDPDPKRPGSTDTVFRADQYRWLIGDVVPFTTGIDVKIENYGSYANTLFGSTAFWYQLDWAADFDQDGDVDSDDFAHLQLCLSGRGQPYESGCDNADLDVDSDVDADDLAAFLPCVSGTDAPANPGCGS